MSQQKEATTTEYLAFFLKNYLIIKIVAIS